MSKVKVLVTGSSGFLGSHIVDELSKRGYSPVLFDQYPSVYNRGKHEEFIGSLNSKSDIKMAMEGCSAVFHFGAQADIDKSSHESVSTLETNIFGTINVLQASIEAKVNHILFASTIYVYSELGSFYRVSKQACEKIIEEYKNEFGLNYTILRFGSLYGPRANKFNSLSQMITQALKEKNCSKREWARNKGIYPCKRCGNLICKFFKTKFF